MFDLVVLLVALLAGGTASVVGFGIGSLLTPFLAVRYGTAAAVVAVTVPHFLGTALRCWRLRAAIDTRILLRFGLLSMAGGVVGAMLSTQLDAGNLTRILGLLLLLTASAQLTGWTSRWHPHGPVVAVLGLASGFFGGIAGSQGGLRAAAMTAFGLAPTAFVATSTAIGLLVDAARGPVYLWNGFEPVSDLGRPIVLASVGVVAGTLLGERILLGLTPARFARIVAVAIATLGFWLLLRTV